MRFWEVCVLAVVLGLNNTFENPARQSFVLEMVGADELRNAVSLNSTMVNAARAIGPAIAGLLIATVGEGVCFLVNAASFGAVVYSLVSMDKAALHPTKPTGRHKGQLREGFSYVAHEPRLGVPLLMMGFVGTLAYEFQVTLPVVAKQTFHGGPETYGFLTAAMGVGAVLGGLVTAARGRTGLRYLTLAGLLFGVAIGFAALAPLLVVELVALAARRLGERHVPRHGQHDPAAAVRPVHARPGHVAVGGRLPGLDARRRAAHRLDRRHDECPDRARGRRDRLSRGGRHWPCRHAQARHPPPPKGTRGRSRTSRGPVFRRSGAHRRLRLTRPPGRVLTRDYSLGYRTNGSLVSP